MARSYDERTFAQIRDNLMYIQEQIANTCAAAGRPEGEVTLMGVTKTVDAARVQEYMEKKEALDLSGVTTHLIGHLQTNKVARIVGEVDMIQSVDSERIARAIDKESAKKGVVTDVLVEVNIGHDAAKTGLPPEQLEPLLYQMAEMPHLRVQGLMTVPPVLTTESDKRKVFLNMHKLFIDIKAKKIDNINMHILSMGMSGDYREAVLEGSTMVRIGSALFGERVY